MIFPSFKVGHTWFPTHQVSLASGVISMSFIVGLLCATGVTPFFVLSAEDIPLMNEVWFGPAAGAFICAVLLVRSSAPPTPPSKSAEAARAVGVVPYWTK